MLHTPFEAIRLEAEIEAAKPSWLRRAREKTEQNRAAGDYVSSGNIWSEIKKVFVAHQRKKCAFCERQLGSDGIEWDVEHFRPKHRVDEWSSPTVTGSTGASDARGYYALALDPRNYLVACKPCNSTHKGNFFPIAAARMVAVVDVDEARAERPYLLNPLDPEDEAPEGLIGFRGVNPRLVAGSAQGRRRAEITIEVLGLTRADLELERCRLVADMWIALLQRENPEGREAAEIVVRSKTALGSPHASCARCFQALFHTDRAAARELAQLAAEFADSHSR